MGFHDLPHQRKAQTCPAVMAGAGAVQLVERLEDILHSVGWDPDAGIDDGYDHQVFPLAFDGYGDASARRGEFDPIIDELAQHPGDLLRIGVDGGDIVVQ